MAGVLASNIKTSVQAYIATLTDLQKQSWPDAQILDLMESMYDQVEKWPYLKASNDTAGIFVADNGDITIYNNVNMASGKILNTEIIRAVDATGLLLQNDGGSTVLAIGDGGQIGFGTSSLHTWSVSYDSGPIEWTAAGIMTNDASGQIFLCSNAYYDGSWKYMVSDGAALLQLDDSKLQYRTVISGTADNAFTFIEIFSVEDNEVYLKGAESGGTNQDTYLYFASDAYLFWDESASGLYWQNANGYIEFGPLNTSWAHIYTDRAAFYFNKGATFLARIDADHGTDAGVATYAGTTVPSSLIDGLIAVKEGAFDDLYYWSDSSSYVLSAFAGGW